MAGSLPLAAHLLWLRLLCVLIASAVVPLSYAIARRLTPSRPAALSLAALTAALPLYTYTATHVTNDALAIPLGALVVLLTLRRQAILLAVALAAALLTKAYFLAFLPAVALLAFFRAAKTAAIALTGALLISGWWYAGNWIHTGSLTGNLVLVQPSMRQIAAAIPSFPLAPTAGFAWKGFLWMGNWSWLVVRPWMYDAITILSLLALVGIAKLLWRRNTEIWLLTAFTGLFALAVLYFGLASYAAGLGAGTHGWYACCVAAPWLALTFAGLRAAVPRASLQPLCVPALALAFATLELFGVHFYQMPYYAGLIRHTPQGGLPAAQLSQFADGGFLVMLQRLLLEKPQSLTPPLLLTLWGFFPASTLTLLGAILWLAWIERREA